MCVRRKHTGAYREYVVIPARNIVKVSDRASYEENALTEPLACVHRSISCLSICPGETVVVIGCGPMGIMHMLLARLSGASTVIVSEPVGYRLRLAEKLGADFAVDPRTRSLERTVKGLTDGRGADVVVETAGVPDMAFECMKLARPGGRIMLFGAFPEGAKVEVEPFQIYRHEYVIKGNYGLNFSDFLMASRLIDEGWIDLKPVISHRFPLEDLKEAIDLIREKKDEVMKVVLIP